MAHFKGDAELVVGKTVPEPEQAPIFIQYLDDERFVTNTEFKLYAAGILVCESGDFVETFIVQLPSFYAFDISQDIAQITLPHGHGDPKGQGSDT